MPWPVLLMARELDLGGSERQLTEIARALDRSKFEPHVGCFRDEGIRATELKAAGVPVTRFPVHSFTSPAAIRGAYQLTRYIRRPTIRLVPAFDYPPAILPVPAPPPFTSPLPLSPHP